MIKSFKHKGLKKFFEKGEVKGINPDHAGKVSRILAVLDRSKQVEDVNLPGYRLHELKGSKKGLWSLAVSGNYRITFEFQNGDAYILDYEDYH